ncbi:MAG: glutamyl-tRNA reductase [Flavobacteriales bacterium]|nr:glutamyl-tRNA reductase [Flavobacteriales bacterium]
MTPRPVQTGKFAFVFMHTANIHILAISHQRLPLEAVGRFHMDPEQLRAAGVGLREAGLAEECFFITTCNRAELVFVALHGQQPDIAALLQAWKPELDRETADLALRGAVLFSGDEAVRHLMSVASSLESLVVGEREILAQVRDQYQHCKLLGLTGDRLRILMRQVVVTAKRVYTETAIANRPVSVVSLAYRALRDRGVKKNARFLVIGAGKTCADMCRYLSKHGFKDLHIFNRTFSKAEALVKEVGGEAYPLDTLVAFDEGFDVIISGIGRGTPIVDRELFATLMNAPFPRKMEVGGEVLFSPLHGRGVGGEVLLVDLALPHDITTDCMGDTPAHLIRIEDLQAQAEENKAGRQQEIGACLVIVEEGVQEFRGMAHERHVERAMSSVPEEVKALRERAVNEVFAKEIASLDDRSREVLNAVLDHLERKYISVPMKLAKRIILDEHQRTAEGRPQPSPLAVADNA